jgi:hypothetical protein
MRLTNLAVLRFGCYQAAVCHQLHSQHETLVFGDLLASSLTFRHSSLKRLRRLKLAAMVVHSTDSRVHSAYRSRQVLLTVSLLSVGILSDSFAATVKDETGAGSGGLVL